MVGEMPNAEGAEKDGLAVGQGVTWAQVVKGLKYDSRKSAISQPQHIDVKPVEVVGEGSDEDLVQGQVVQGPMGRGGLVEDPKVSKVPNKYKEVVKE